MAYNCKNVTFIVCLLNIIFVVCFLYTYKLWEKRSDSTVIGPGKFANPSLKFVAVLFRHGNRAPEISYKTDPYANYFLEGRGRLTKLGKRNMYRKGQILRNQYNGFLSEHYKDSEILTQTTNIERTYMSAAMVLAGLYPPKDYQKWSDTETVWQPIPIHENSPDHGLMFIEREKCPLFDVLIKDMFTDNNNNSNQNSIEAPLLSYLSEKCGQEITKKSLMKLYDLFMCQISDGLKLPEWITLDQIQLIKSIVFKRETLDKFFGKLKLQKLIIGPLLNEIALTMESCSNNTNNNTTRKMHLYSGHDISIATALGFLGNRIEIPDFGASLNFHVYLDETIGYIVKLFFYDRWSTEKEEELSIPICGNPCKLQNFVNIMRENFSRGWTEECKKDN